jgi:hypothetical protein
VKIALRAYTILLLMVSLAHAQDQVRPAGLIWEVPDSINVIQSELQQIDQAGFNHILIIGQPDEELLRMLRNYEMRIILQVPEYYLTRYQINHRGTELRTLYEQTWNLVRDYPYLTGLSLFSEGEVYRPEFMESISELVPNGAKENLLLFSSTFQVPQGYFYPINRMGLCYDPECVNDPVNLQSAQPVILYLDTDLKPGLFRWFQLFKSKGTSHIYVPFREMINEEGNLTQAGQLYDILKKDPGFLVPGDPVDSDNTERGLSVMWAMILLFTWAIHYSFDPTYRKSIQRFFQSNRIFVEDLVKKRSRMIFSNYMSVLYVAILFGITSLAVAEYAINDTSIQLLQFFIPFLNEHNIYRISFFGGMLVGLSQLIIMIPWGAYVNRSKCHIANFSTIALWPNHILFGLLILLLVILPLEPSNFIIVNLLGLMFLMPLGAYSYAGIRLVGYSNKPVIIYAFLFYSIPFLVAGGTWWLVRQQSPLVELSELLLRLS